MRTTVTTAQSLDRARLARLCATTLLHFMAMGIYMSTLPLFVHFDLGGSRTMVGLAVGSFFPAAVLMRPLIGSGLDAWGRRPFLLVATGMMAATSFLFLAAETIWFVVVLRLFQGFAGAAYYTGAATAATDIGPETRRAETIALFSLFLYGGFASGPAIGEWLVRQAGFEAAWITAGAVSATSFLLVVGMPETLHRDERDGARVRYGLDRAALAPGLVLLCAASGYAAITSFSPLYARHVGIGSSGGLYAVFALTLLFFRVLTRKLADRHTRLRIVLPGIALATAGLGLMASFQVPGAGYAGVAVYAIGFAFLFPALMAFTADRVPRSRRGSALATFTMFFDLGAAIGSYVVGAVADRFGFGPGFALPASLCAIATGAVAVAVIRGEPVRTKLPSITGSGD